MTPDQFAPAGVVYQALEYFRTNNLKVASADFRHTINAYISNQIVIPEDVGNDAAQRRQLLSFYWGHDHDFGGFKIEGEMGARHVWMLSRFFGPFGVAPEMLAGRRVLDVGCWTGGVSLVLNRLGAEVLAIDEARKYVHALNYLAYAFGLENFRCEPRSLYDLTDPGHREAFDFVFCLGVVYHLTDPIIGLRRLYHVLKPGATLCVETMSIDAQGSLCEYEGPSRQRGKFGYNWFVPSPEVLVKWLDDTGFEEIRVGDGFTELGVTQPGDPMGPNRCFATARKKPNHQLCRAGLSIKIE